MNLKGKNLLTLLDYSPKEIEYLLDLSKELKIIKHQGKIHEDMKGKNIAVIFEKSSTRTRTSFVVAAYDEGAHPEYIGKDELQLGKKESIKDTARVLGRMFDGIAYRGYCHKSLEELAKYSGIPVWNALTDKFHPTQVLADLLTIKEKKGYIEGIKLCYMGDGRNNMSNSLIIGGIKMGLDIRIAAPRELFPDEEIIQLANEIMKVTKGKLTVTESIDEGLKDVDVIYTDTWISMGEEDKCQERINLLKAYAVDMDTIKKAKDDVLFMHCLPAFHNLETEMGEKIFDKYGLEYMEVSDEVFESEYSVVFEQAENRLHTIKAVMVATI